MVGLFNDIPKEYQNTQHERKPHGVIFYNGKEVASTLQCPHCAMHFISYKGSGMHRSFCMRCRAVTCGKRACIDACTPWVAETGEMQSREV